MPTSPRVRYKGRGRTGGVEPRPYESVTTGAGKVCRGGRLCPPDPDNAMPCRAGPVCPAGCGKNLSGRRGRRPLRRVTRGCGMSGRCRHRPLRKCILRCVGEGLCPSRGRGKNPPLRKRYKGCNGRATARVAPTDGLQEGAVCRADVGIGPYESVTRGAGKESPSHGFAVPAPFRQGGQGRGVRIATPVTSVTGSQ